MVSCGGFQGSAGLPYSTGGLVEVARHLPEEVIAKVELFNAKAPAWDALLRALVRVHELQPIARVEVY